MFTRLAAEESSKRQRLTSGQLEVVTDADAEGLEDAQSVVLGRTRLGQRKAKLSNTLD